MNLEQVLATQKDYFKSGHTLPPSHRVKQLRKLKRAILKYQDELVTAVDQDFGKSEFEVVATEIIITLKEVQLAIRRVKA